MIAKFAKILRVTGVKTGVGVLIFDVNRSRIGVGFCNFGAGLESESQKSDSGHLCFRVVLINDVSCDSKSSDPTKHRKERQRTENTAKDDRERQQTLN